MRACFHAIQTECAVQIANLLRLKQVQLTSARALIAANTIISSATPANLRFLHPDFSRRNQGAYEMKLANGANVLTERGAAKQAIDEQGGQKISRDDPGCQPGTVPQSKGFVCPQIKGNQARGHPLRP